MQEKWQRPLPGIGTKSMKSWSRLRSTVCKKTTPPKKVKTNHKEIGLEIFQPDFYFDNVPICLIKTLPQKLFDVAHEPWLLCPAKVLKDLADVTFDIGRHGAGAVVVLVVALAGVDIDEVVLDGALNTSRHVVIDGGKTGRHADGFILAELWTVGALHLGIVEVNAVDVNSVCGFVTADNAVKTMLTKRTNGAVAYFIVVSFRCEDLFSGLWGVTFLFHVYSDLLVQR